MRSADPVIAVYLSSHGYGHCTRATALLEELVSRGAVRLHVTASCPRWLWPQRLDRHTQSWTHEPCDVGVVQPDDLTVDPEATAAAIARWQRDYELRVEREAAKLRGGVDLVLGDVPPLAFDAASRAGIPAVALANFSWDWIYAGLGLDDAARRAADAYASAELLLELDPACPMPAFRHRLPLGVIGRRPRNDRHAVRQRLGVRPDQCLVLVAFRDTALVRLPEPCDDIRYLSTGGAIARTDVVQGESGAEFMDLLAAADAVVAKPGYGIIGDAAVCATPILYAMRRGFPEDAVLTAWLDANFVSARVSADALRTGTWRETVQRLMMRDRPRPVGRSGVLLGCDAIREILG